MAFRCSFACQLCVIAFFALALLIAVSCSMILSTYDTVLAESRSALKEQTATSSVALIQATAEGFDSEIQAGVSSLLMPIAVALRDAAPTATSPRGTSFPWKPLPSYLDHSGRLRQPLTDKDDDPAASHPRIGVRRFGNDPISKSASSVYLVNQYGEPDGNVFNGMAPSDKEAGQNLDLLHDNSDIKQLVTATSFMDLFAAPGWLTSPEYFSVYIGSERGIGSDRISMFRQYPGHLASPTFCGVAKASIEELKILKDAVDEKLEVNKDITIGVVGARLRGKKIQLIGGVPVTSRSDVQSRIDDAITSGESSIYVVWNSYDPTARSWYLDGVARDAQAAAADMTMDRTLGVHFGSPYKDARDGSWMISGSKAFKSSSTCAGGLPECGSTDEVLLGVVSMDLYIPFVRHLTNRIRIRQTGSAHLFATADGAVLSSPQWEAGPTDAAMNIADVKVRTSTFDSEHIGTMKREANGVSTFDEAQIVHTHVLHGRYAIVVATPQKEITAALEDNLESINEGTNAVIVTAIIVCACLGLVVLLAIFFVRRSIVPDLCGTAREAEQIVSNLGGNLRDGLECVGDGKNGYWLVRSIAGLQEVKRLRGGFHRMLATLMQNRLRSGLQGAEANPCHLEPQLQRGSTPPPWASGLAMVSQDNWLQKERLKVAAPCKGGGYQEEDPTILGNVRCVNKVFGRMMILVGGALLIAVAVSAAVTGTSIHSQALLWLDPIRDTLVAEERATLPSQLAAVADTVGFTFRRHINSLVTWKQLAERAYNTVHHASGDLELADLSDSEFLVFPNFQGVDGEGNLQNLPTGWVPLRKLPQGLHDSTRVAGKRYNYWASGYYRNANSWDKDGFASPLDTAWTDKEKQQERMLSALDAFARVIYFSDDLTNVMIGMDETESYRSFPWMDKSSFKTWTGNCVRDKRGPKYIGAPRREGYTPLCRAWYESARKSKKPGAVTFNPIGVSASTGKAFLALSAGLYDSNNNFFGVAGIEANIQYLTNVLSKKVLTNGYFYLADRNQYLVVHPQLAPKESALIVMKEIAAGCGEDMDLEKEQVWLMDEFMTFEKQAHGMLQHIKCGQEYLIAWQHVENTELIVFLSVPLSDITKKADDAQATIEGQISLTLTLATVFSGISAVLFLLLIALASSKAVGGILLTVNAMAAENYDVAVPSVSFFHSKEICQIIESMQHLLIALRFSDAKCNRQSQQAIANSEAAQAMMERSGNSRGLGVVMNNKAAFWHRVSRGEIKDVDSTGAEKKALDAFEDAIQLARSEQPPSAESQERLATRLSGKGMVYLDQSNDSEALKCFVEAIQVLQAAAKWRPLAWLAFQLSTINKTKKSPPLTNTSQTAAKAAAAILPTQNEILPSECTALAQLCLVLHEQEAVVMRWALAELPVMDKITCMQIAAHAKGDKHPALVAAIDQLMGGYKQYGWVAGDVDASTVVLGIGSARQPYCFVLCLDVSWSMLFANQDLKGIGKAGPGEGGRWQRHDGQEFLGIQVNSLQHLLPDEKTRLDTSCQSIRSLCKNHIRKGDMLGFMTFGGDQKWDLPIQKIGDASPIEGALSKVATTTSGTAFFSSVVACLQSVESKATGMSNWVIALTDGDDNRSADDAIDTACRMLTDGDTNIAIITVGNLSDKTIQQITRMVSAAQAKSKSGKESQGLHFVAANSDKIASAFQQVAAAISVMSEAL